MHHKHKILLVIKSLDVPQNPPLSANEPTTAKESRYHSERTHKSTEEAQQNKIE
jgi:hypothetical protein